MENCIFCKIANGEIPSNKVYEDDQVLAFYDLDPQAPVHVLIIPKAHYDSILAVPCGKDNPLPAMTAAAQKRVAVCPGDPFYEEDRDVRTMRINYSNSSDEAIE